ncbi:hypothetical protein HNP84_010306 [Thermocatellispora tengchongensis]|uniref:Uncharacterized protein n=1 Tax=Thermocatellispora tengchongensis TaxID=1073253 RepID=A0A840PM18_9ACTN|nr:chromate transporter [Thermocatellispora tengchongensis]MBB5140538.1 hypothetical protein [Thermocatellispora tengchongensis]
MPCFLFIFLGARYVERLRHNTHQRRADRVTAAVVGVIASLALYFAQQMLFATTEMETYGPLHLHVPDLASVNVLALVITTAALS